MTPTRVTLALVLVMVAVLLATGCAGQPVAEKQMSNTTGTVTNTPTVEKTILILPVPTECPVPVNGSYWIKINPISEIHRGDQIFISGTTSLQKETPLELMVYPSFPSHQKCSTSNLYSRPIKINEGANCTNVFSTSFDTSGIYPGEVIITVRSSTNTSISADIFPNLSRNITPLMLPGAVSNASENVPIVIMPLHDVKKGNIQSFYGRTILSQPILFSVYEAHGKKEMLSGSIAPLSYGQKSSLLSFRLNTSDFETGQYMIDISAVCSDVSTTGWFNVTE